MLAVMFVMYNY